MTRALLTSLALIFSLAISGIARAQVKVGVLLPLSGPLAADAANAAQAIKAVFSSASGQIAYILYDDQARVESAVQGAERLVRENKVVALIGPISANATAAIAPKFASDRIPIVSLGAPSQGRLSSQLERNPWLISFAPISNAHVDIVGLFIKQKQTRRLAVAYFSPAAVDYADELATRLAKTGGVFDSVYKAPVGFKEEAERFALEAKANASTIVIGTLQEPQAEELLRQLRRSGAPNPTIVFSPPALQTKAHLAATLIFDAVKKGAKTSDAIFKSIQESGLYQKSTRTLAVDWTVTTYAVDKVLTDKLVLATTGTLSCSCYSSDGKVCKTRRCTLGQSCERTPLGGDDCKVDCVSRR